MPRSKQVSEQMRARSRASILKAARRLFADQGYFSSKVADIAKLAEMSQGNVYWYFESKQAVLKAVLAEGFESLERMTGQVAESQGSGSEKLEALVMRTMRLYDEQGDFNRILMSLMAHGGTAFLGELGFDMTEIGMRYHANLIRVFAQARAEGVVLDIEPNLLVMLYFGLFNGLMVTYAEDWGLLPPVVLRQAALRMLGAGEV
ncbi:MAG: TetR/AcrR family transcriptional regulator [Anaerolineales bacterium]|jgi:AcrR family transcriptional regulator